MFSVHCARTPTTAMTIASGGPSSRSAVRSAAYDTDSVDPLASAIGRFTFQMEVTQPMTNNAPNSAGRAYVHGKKTAKTQLPAAMTEATYSRAGCGNEIHRRAGRCVMDRYGSHA